MVLIILDLVLDGGVHRQFQTTGTGTRDSTITRIGRSSLQIQGILDDAVHEGFKLFNARLAAIHNSTSWIHNVTLKGSTDKNAGSRGVRIRIICWDIRFGTGSVTSFSIVDVTIAKIGNGSVHAFWETINDLLVFCCDAGDVGTEAFSDGGRRAVGSTAGRVGVGNTSFDFGDGIRIKTVGVILKTTKSSSRITACITEALPNRT